MNISEHWKMVSNYMGTFSQFNLDTVLFNDAARQAQMDAIDYRIGSYAGMSANGQINGVFYPGSQKVIEELQPLMSMSAVTVTNQGTNNGNGNYGLIPYPQNTLRLVSVDYTYSYEDTEIVQTRDLTKPIERVTTTKSYPVDFQILEPEQFKTRCQSSVAPPSLKFPVGRYYNPLGIMVAPTELIGKTVSVNIIQVPPAPQYIGPDDPGNVDYKLPSSCDSELVYRAMRWLGVYWKNDQIIALATSLKPNNLPV